MCVGGVDDTSVGRGAFTSVSSCGGGFMSLKAAGSVSTMQTSLLVAPTDVVSEAGYYAAGCCTAPAGTISRAAAEPSRTVPGERVSSLNLKFTNLVGDWENMLVAPAPHNTTTQAGKHKLNKGSRTKPLREPTASLGACRMSGA